MKNIIRKILKEDQRERYLNKIVQVMKNDVPLFKNMELYGFYDQLSEDELNYVLSGIFGEPVRLNGNKIYDKNGNKIYFENSDGYWVKKEYDKYGNVLYGENSYGEWWKREYDKYGNLTYKEDSNGKWAKREYDKYGNIIYYEDSDGEKTYYR